MLLFFIGFVHGGRSGGPDITLCSGGGIWGAGEVFGEQLWGSLVRSLHLCLHPCLGPLHLFGCLGFAFKFAEMEYISKLNKLLQVSKAFYILSSIIDHDVENDIVRKPGSHSSNLRRFRLGLDLIKALFEQLLSSRECSPKEVASNAYAQVCVSYHIWPVRKAVAIGMCTLRQLLLECLLFQWGCSYCWSYMIMITQ